MLQPQEIMVCEPYWNCGERQEKRCREEKYVGEKGKVIPL